MLDSETRHDVRSEIHVHVQQIADLASENANRMIYPRTPRKFCSLTFMITSYFVPDSRLARAIATHCHRGTYFALLIAWIALLWPCELFSWSISTWEQYCININFVATKLLGGYSPPIILPPRFRRLCLALYYRTM